jgi:hypothetical protein
MGADVTYREARVDHTVDPAWLPELSAWVKQRRDDRLGTA